MDSCENCARIMIETNGQPSPEQRAQMGTPDTKPWCEVCRDLMLAHYQLRQEHDKALANADEIDQRINVTQPDC